MPDTTKKVAIIGGGPGGYVAAIRAAQLGADVTIVEKDAFGGTCLNRGCIPTKVLLHAAGIISEARNGERIGIHAPDISVNWPGLMRRKEEVVSRLAGGVEFLLKSNNVRIVRGSARFLSSTDIEVSAPDGVKQRIEADAAILATGSLPAVPPVPGFDLPGILTSDGALSLEKIPSSLLLVGGGVIGVELATAFASFGTEVTVVEMLPEILPNHDPELAVALKKILMSRRIRFHTSARVEKVRMDEDHYAALISEDGKEPQELRAESVLVCTGRRPNTAGLGLEELGARMEKGRILTDCTMRTNLAGLYAIGDCASPVMLAHVASAEGEIAAENIMGYPVAMDYGVIPSGVYTSPELASVGALEKNASEGGRKVKTGRFSMAGNGKSIITGEDQGMIKIAADAETGEVLGVHMLAARATDLIMEAALAMKCEATVEEIIATVHAHPTASEGLREAALDFHGQAIHMPPRHRPAP